MACFDSVTGNFPEALQWLEIELQNPRYFSERAISLPSKCPKRRVRAQRAL